MYGSGKTRFGEEYLNQVKNKKSKTDFEKMISEAFSVSIRLKSRQKLPPNEKERLEEELFNDILLMHPLSNVKEGAFMEWLKYNGNYFREYGTVTKLFQLGLYMYKSNTSISTCLYIY